MKYVHLFPNEKFTGPYIEFVNKNFKKNEHLFLIIGGVSEDKIKITVSENVKKISNSIYSMSLLLKEMYRSDKILLHGLFIKRIVLLLFIQPWLLGKCYWGIWGGDLYWYKTRSKGIMTDFYEKIRTFVIKRMGGLITHVKGDYELAKLWYGAKGKYYHSFMYPNNLFNDYDLSNIEKDSNTVYIQVGNSADPTNNHIEVFNKLKVYKDKKIEIICPLSYGNTAYKDIVIHEGKKIFGERFHPLVNFIPFNEYLNLLAKIDIAIFNHKRQQAMGNIITLLGLGKKVYIKDDITTWNFCIDHELKVFNSNGEFNDIFERMNETITNKNISNIKNNFSEEKLIKDLKEIF